MAVRIRMKRMGRIHRPFYRICAMDGRAPRDGKVIEELGHYDPLVKETDARAILNGERIAYWLSVGAQPSEGVERLLKAAGVEVMSKSSRAAATPIFSAPAPPWPRSPRCGQCAIRRHDPGHSRLGSPSR